MGKLWTRLMAPFRRWQRARRRRQDQRIRRVLRQEKARQRRAARRQRLRLPPPGPPSADNRVAASPAVAPTGASPPPQADGGPPQSVESSQSVTPMPQEAPESPIEPRLPEADSLDLSEPTAATEATQRPSVASTVPTLDGKTEPSVVPEIPSETRPTIESHSVTNGEKTTPPPPSSIPDGEPVDLADIELANVPSGQGFGFSQLPTPKLPDQPEGRRTSARMPPSAREVSSSEIERILETVEEQPIGAFPEPPREVFHAAQVGAGHGTGDLQAKIDRILTITEQLQTILAEVRSGQDAIREEVKTAGTVE